MNLNDLKKMSVPELQELAESLGVERLPRARKQDVIFTVLKGLTGKGESIHTGGVLEILQDGFGL